MNEQQRQKKLAKKRSKQRQRTQVLAAEKQQLASLAGMMTSASSGTVQSCFVGIPPKRTELNGMVTVTLVRSGPHKQVALANFLVDLWCLGIKDCGGQLFSPAECREALEDFSKELELEPIDPSAARAIVEAGVNYAASLGLNPHPDYRKVALLWGDIPVGELPVDISLGRAGQPCYIVGPFDDDAKQQFICRTLRDNVGEGNFDVVTAADQNRSDFLSGWMEAHEHSDERTNNGFLGYSPRANPRLP